MAINEKQIDRIDNMIRSYRLSERERIELAGAVLKRQAGLAAADFAIPDERLCKGCGKPLDDAGRSDRRHHGPPCRIRAYRKRNRVA